jgi:hypothetical protein
MCRAASALDQRCASCGAAVIVRIVLVLYCVSCTGCSFAFVQPPPARPDPKPSLVDCTHSPLAPIADLGLTAYAALAVPAVELWHGLGHGGSAPSPASTGQRVWQGVLLGVAGLAAWSAGYGFKATAECRHEQAVWEHQAAPRPVHCVDDAACKHGRRCEVGVCVWPERELSWRSGEHVRSAPPHAPLSRLDSDAVRRATEWVHVSGGQ